MDRLIKVENVEDIPEYIVGTSFETLLRYHNLGEPFSIHEKAQILIGMCMDNRKMLRIPENFAYILRTGGGNMRYSEFKISYAVSVGGIKEIALIAHTQCAMVNLISKKEEFINGLVENAGWELERAQEHFISYAPMFEIENELDFVISEAQRLRRKYPKIKIIPMMYKIEDNRLYIIRG